MIILGYYHDQLIISLFLYRHFFNDSYLVRPIILNPYLFTFHPAVNVINEIVALFFSNEIKVYVYCFSLTGRNDGDDVRIRLCFMSMKC